MTECIKRERSFWTTCHCPACVRDRARKRKLQSMGTTLRVPNDYAWSILAPKIEQGWTARAIGSATGLGAGYFTRHVAQYRKGRRVFLGPAVAAAVVNMGVPTEGQVGVESSRRRLRALAVIGHGLTSIEAESGINFSTLAAIRGDHSVRVGARTAIDVTVLYDRLHAVPGGDKQAIRLAREKGWASPFAWNNIDTDPAPVGRRRLNNDYDTNDLVDEAVVVRILAGDKIPANRAERLETVRRWVASGRSEASLCKRMGWHEGRYSPTRREGAA